MSNYAALAVIFAVWLYYGRGLNLCLLIASYYAAFILSDITVASGYFTAAVDEVMATYVIQCSTDGLALVCCIALSEKYQKNIKILYAYGSIIATSLALNGLMLYDQMIDLSVIYKLHSLRQEFSIPLDVLFAVLGSGERGKITVTNHRSLHCAGRTNYNRLNRISNHSEGA